MRMALKAFTVALSVFAAACAGPVRSTGGANGQTVSYAMTQEQADTLLLAAMLKTFPDSEIERSQVPLPVVRYQARMTNGFDKHIIIATARPAEGVDSGPVKAGSYVFEVSDFGSMFLQGANRAAVLFDEIQAGLKRR